MDMTLPEGVDALNEDGGPRERRVPARLLACAPGAWVAFPAHTTMGLVDRPALVRVPGAPAHAPGLIEWEGRRLPLLDLGVLLLDVPPDESASTGHVLVLAYQAAPRAPLSYGAVRAPALARLIDVADSQQCALPPNARLWPALALSCFTHEGVPVPVLDTARLFAAPWVAFPAT